MKSSGVIWLAHVGGLEPTAPSRPAVPWRRGGPCAHRGRFRSSAVMIAAGGATGRHHRLGAGLASERLSSHGWRLARRGTIVFDHHVTVAGDRGAPTDDLCTVPSSGPPGFRGREHRTVIAAVRCADGDGKQAVLASMKQEDYHRSATISARKSGTGLHHQLRRGEGGSASTAARTCWPCSAPGRPSASSRCSIRRRATRPPRWSRSRPCTRSRSRICTGSSRSAPRWVVTSSPRSPAACARPTSPSRIWSSPTCPAASRRTSWTSPSASAGRRTTA